MKKILLEIVDYLFSTKFGHFIALAIIIAIFSAVLTLLGLSFWLTFSGGMVVSLLTVIRDCNQRWL
jgi:hypothetical protein